MKDWNHYRKSLLLKILNWTYSNVFSLLKKHLSAIY